jgi:hypothetical protein
MVKRRSSTQQVLRVVATFAAVALIHFIGAATAQTPVKQIKLTEEQVQNFIAAKTPVAKEIQGSTSDQPDPKLQAGSEAVVKKSGFKDFAEYDNVAANILMVVAGIDPLTKRYTDPQSAVKKWIANVTADRTVPQKVQKELLNEFEKVLKAAQPINIPATSRWSRNTTTKSIWRCSRTW